MEFTVAVEVKPGAKKRELTFNAAKNSLVIRTTKRPVECAANKDVVDMLAEHFKVAKSCISLVRGHSGKKKIFKIMA